MELRDLRQKQLSDAWWERGKYGIICAAPRTGKTFVGINVLEKFPSDCRVLITYPDVKIKQSWLGDFKKRGYENSNVTFTTFVSLHKHLEEEFDLIIVDEIHLLSEKQIENLRTLHQRLHKPLLGLTGTLSSWTQRVLREELGLIVVAFYPMEQAIEEGILPDYEINIVSVELDNKTKLNWGKRWSTEKARWNSFKYLMEKEDKEGREPNFHVRLKLIEILQRSIAKKRKTIELIEQFKDERLLVFCGRTEIADSLGIPSYHSKSSEKKVFEDFVNGSINHLAVIKIGNTGVTYTPLNKVIVNYFDSNAENLTQRINRAMSLEYDNPEKKAVIYIVCSTEKKERDWLKKALSMFSDKKIKYL
ncbi:MAG TPA: hypothetical protein PLR64_02265 [Candidatus Dojkabacteria bacterium]|nr:hypothetical protein [Candidatus Dojkabacteria bacterium]